MKVGMGRRNFFRRVFAASACGAGAMLSRKNAFAIDATGSLFAHSNTGIFPMENPDYAIGRFKDRMTIQYYGLSCFLIVSSKGVRIVMDPFIASKQVLHSEVKKEPADVVTVSCGSYAHCHVFSVGGTPYIYQITEPTVLHGITFRGVATQHLKMLEASVLSPGQNVVMCFEVDGIKLCHLGALGHTLTDDQVKQIGTVEHPDGSRRRRKHFARSGCARGLQEDQSPDHSSHALPERAHACAGLGANRRLFCGPEEEDRGERGTDKDILRKRSAVRLECRLLPRLSS